MLEIKNAKKIYNKHKRNKVSAINNTTLTLDSGLVALLGPSGCGKTTLLNTIGGLDKLDSGKIYINGKKVNSLFSYKTDKLRNLNVGYIFQDYKLIDNLTVFDNVAISLKLIGLKNKAEIKKRVEYTLDKVGMLRYKRRPTYMLSGGERQRVAIARALVKNPDIILADEPTGNLDSRNSLEIMKIIKTISKDKLVILVTHEAELAKFYASRIIEIKDGSIINDYQNTNSFDLDYKIDNVFYLKDFDIQNRSDSVNVFMDKGQELKVDIVVSNNNIYIKSNNLNTINIVDDNSSVEFKDEHYKKIKADEIITDIDYSILNNNFKWKYSSILNLFTLIINGFKKVFNYSILKKILLIGFFTSGMFTLYAISLDESTKIIKDEDFVTYNSEYLLVEKLKVSVDDYMIYKNADNVDFIMPSESIFSFNLYNKLVFQTTTKPLNFTASLSPFSILDKNKIILGNIPTNNNEIIIDKMIIDRLNKNTYDINPKQIGLFNINDYLNKEIEIANLSFKIVGITDTSSPVVYVDNSKILKIVNDANKEDYYGSDDSDNGVKNINYIENYTITKGRVPSNDYEIIVYQENKDEFKLNKEIKDKINSHNLVVVGYYDSIYGDIGYIGSENTYLYQTIENTPYIIVHSTDKDKTINYLNEHGYSIKDTYEYSKARYIANNFDGNTIKKLMAYIFLLISLIEIYLMIRSSFFSRIKEVGIYRAIGVKKTDIYKMFLGEIIAITVIACIPGILFMAYILSGIVKYASSMFVINSYVLIKTILIVSIFNILIGILPIFLTILNTPAYILSRHDVD